LQFSSCAQVLKLCALEALAGNGGGELSVVDYSIDRLVVASAIGRSSEERRAWLHGRRAEGIANRWVHLSADDQRGDAGFIQTLRLLSARYRLHPMALDDVCHQQRPSNAASAQHHTGDRTG
jgi:hypothetical protein